MKWFSATRMVLLAAIGCIQLSGASAAAATPAFSLNPAFCTPVCGASQLAERSWIKPARATYEEQTVEVDVAASSLLQAGVESVFVSNLSGDQAFTSSGQFTANATGGGIGIVLGSAQPPYHPTCVGANSGNRQFGIFAYSWGDPSGPTTGMVACKNIDKALLASGTVRISVTTSCGPGLRPLCLVSATLTSVSTGAVLATASANSVRLKNPLNARKVWYGVSNYDAASPNYPVTFTPRVESYYAEVEPACNPICP
ncbi:hypothetical protein ABIE09_001875 [Lysobacter enzymogenes]|uniref:hypothetical protein n=1 Tax=Lysobacter enzymogenes TaxID=69 RepID=UPI00089C2930|nr:hypothetical protein [Lysobacter enzymogenes]SDX73186.1 hypothetical protein SAMN05421681_107168 [Lysobacter enzymogenes]